MNDRFKVSTGLARRLGDLQVPLSKSLRRAGLPAGFFNQDKISVTTSELFALWRAIGETSDSIDLDRPFVTHNAELLAATRAQLESELHTRNSSSNVGDEVKNTLKRSLAGKRPNLQHVARELRMSARTLQRRLTDAGITFQELVEDARRELARHYLRQSSIELNETAYLLGYENANSFFRAFHLWEGIPPGEWRAQHAIRPAEVSAHQASVSSV